MRPGCTRADRFIMILCPALSSERSSWCRNQGIHMRSCSKRSVPYTGASEGYFKQVRAAVRTITRYSMGV
jgi:hypothetical protein